MAETKMSVELIAHTQLSKKFRDAIESAGLNPTDGQAVATTAIRTCYSANKPSEILIKEGAKYFGNKAADGKGGTEADRLIRMIVASKHTSTLEGITFTFAVEGVSRALLAQITRHRVGFSFSVQSQRYVKFGSGDRSGGFDYVKPEKIPTLDGVTYSDAYDVFTAFMESAQEAYDELRELGVPAEDARSILPNAAATNLVLTVNLRALLDFYSKRRKGRGAQSEICDLAEALRAEVEAVEPWVKPFFEEA